MTGRPLLCDGPTCQPDPTSHRDAWTHELPCTRALIEATPALATHPAALDGHLPRALYPTAKDTP
ncbi:hypothetical protein AB0O47_39390 [Streptomyces noursei]|uniref:hypothetical protein n=1 Tax=Streptomyces noursei TaxID=1971 RepID=UPI00344B677B